MLDNPATSKPGGHRSTAADTAKHWKLALTAPVAGMTLLVESWLRGQTHAAVAEAKKIGLCRRRLETLEQPTVCQKPFVRRRVKIPGVLLTDETLLELLIAVPELSP